MEALWQIAEYVRMATGYDIDALRTKKRDTFRVAARQLFCYFARNSSHSCEAIGDYLNIDYVTVSHGSRKIEAMMHTDEIIKNYVSKYEIMSNKKQILEIAPPEVSCDQESYSYEDFVCPSCNGRGYNVNYDDRDSIYEACKRCGGSGRLSAIIHIEWTAK